MNGALSYNDLFQLHTFLKQRGIQVNIETFHQDQLAKCAELPLDARNLMLAVLNRHPDFTDGHGFYQGRPAYAYAADMVQQAESGGEAMWKRPEFAAVWEKGVLPEPWQASTEQLWMSLSVDQKLGLLQTFSTDWVFHEARLIDLVEYSDVYFYSGFMSLLSRYFADAIDAGDETLAQKIRDAMRSQVAAGGLAGNLVNAALQCNKPAFWEDIAEILLAVQKQESIRQIIVNALPEAGTEAQILLLETIFDHDIQRFVPVAIQLNRWFNLPLADGVAHNEKNIEQPGRIALDRLKENPVNPATIIENDELTKAYFGLWAMLGRRDKRVWDTCRSLLEHPNPAKRAMALHALLGTGFDGFLFAKQYTRDTDWSVRWNVFRHMQQTYAPDAYSPEDGVWVFFETLVKGITGKSLKNPAPRYTWDDYQFQLNEVFNHWIYRVAESTGRYLDLLPYRKRMDADLRGGLLNGHFQQALQLIYEGKGSAFKPTDVERKWIVETIQDTSANVSAGAFILYDALVPLPEEVTILIKLLTRKTDSTRKNALGVLIGLPDGTLTSAIKTLLSKKNEQQLLAGLDLLQQLKNQNRLRGFVQEQAEALSKRPNISSQAELILRDLLEDAGQVYDATNGYGLYDPAKTRVVPALNKPQEGFFAENMFGKPMLGLSPALDKLEMALRALDSLFTTHENHSYTITNWDGSTQAALISDPYFQRNKQFNYEPGYAESLAALPLPEVWEGWLKEYGLTPFDRFLLSGNTTNYPFFAGNVLPQWLTDLVRNYTQTYVGALLYENRLGLKYPNHCSTLIGYLRDDAAIHDQIRDLAIDGTTHYFASIPTDRMYEKFRFHPENPEASFTWREAWQGYLNHLQQWEYAMDQEGLSEAERLSDQLFTRFWAPVYWFYRTLDPLMHQGWTCCQAPTLGRAHLLGLIDQGEVYDVLLNTGLLGQMSYITPAAERRLLDTYPVFNAFYAEAVPHFLSIELERGDTPTTVSGFVAFFKKIEGLQYFVQIIKGLGDDALHRGYSYGGESKKVQFSRLLKNCFPGKTDTFEAFQKALDEGRHTEKRLLQVSLYAPQWLPWMSKYLDWPGLESAAWCMHAHGNNYLDLQKESELALYTQVSVADFKDGAVDVNWFREAFDQLGPARWEMVYDAAHYISESQGYVRARVYADAILGKLLLEECKQRITDKRNKDYVVALGLIPLDDANPQQDILDRYRFIQAFKAEGKNFGSQRRRSEKRACELAVDNLARNAGYADPARLTWAMEALDIQELMQRVKTVVIDDTSVELRVDAFGKVTVVAVKGGKTLSSIPSALRKDPAVAALIETRDQLNDQRERILSALEEAMVLGDAFLPDELQALLPHPVVRPLLERLVMVAGSTTGFFRGDHLLLVNGEQRALDEAEALRIAHPYDLQQTGEWPAYQQAAAEQQLQQPFEQIFRQLYLPNAEEMEAEGESKRFAGKKVQPTQAAGIFRSRGWSANYYEGMQKVYHRERIVAAVDAYADWQNPASNTTPVEILSVRFYHTQTREALPLKTLPTAIFSEVMRDVDKVVTDAQAGGVELKSSPLAG